ncbi:hypothetical protein CROQUDRAFT_98526 [Cronartium quercuum f. sp. fusiforme G11]|uniref:Uncharacterized protein n=1 Tax=Cronartium quercuum f. sp. fusiforme G11 TaxID=708437 RepID=A0A9P6T7N1_9BASI|nr:hypothetical protein CROQUDRAFT_98526 [Cronartium quercuum f. sp. fusiforme G11]
MKLPIPHHVGSRLRYMALDLASATHKSVNATSYNRVDYFGSVDRWTPYTETATSSPQPVSSAWAGGVNCLMIVHEGRLSNLLSKELKLPRLRVVQHNAVKSVSTVFQHRRMNVGFGMGDDHKKIGLLRLPLIILPHPYAPLKTGFRFSFRAGSHSIRFKSS